MAKQEDKYTSVQDLNRCFLLFIVRWWNKVYPIRNGFTSLEMSKCNYSVSSVMGLKDRFEFCPDYTGVNK